MKCLDNMLVSDITHRYIMRTQQMYLQGKPSYWSVNVVFPLTLSMFLILLLLFTVYLPPIAISIHSLVAQHERKNIEWPKSFQRSWVSSNSWNTGIALCICVISIHLSTDTEQLWPRGWTCSTHGKTAYPHTFQGIYQWNHLQKIQLLKCYIYCSHQP